MWLSDLQKEHDEWSTKHFGPKNSVTRNVDTCLLGIVEEVGELDEAQFKSSNTRSFLKNTMDALGDITIYMLDFATQKDWDVGSMIHVVDLERFSRLGLSVNQIHLNIRTIVGRLAHARLKQIQKIRYTPEQVENLQEDLFMDLLLNLESFAMAHGWDFKEVVEETAKSVFKRDWESNPLDANKKAEVL
jgi:NTP pyrophosphatase (non-canonical NTP hydrolase)